MNRIFLIFLFSTISFSAISQDARIITVSFVPTIDNKNVKLDEDIIIDSAQHYKINITKLKFYVSHLSLYKDEQLVWQDNELAHLMDAENEMNIKFTIKKNIDFNKIKFGLGIDSITNVSGALDGDLDPLKGMYWTWQSGYVNFKMEGTSTAIRSESQRFEYHLGGYSAENNTYNTIDLIVGNSEAINIAINFHKFLSDFNVVTHLNVMSPGKVAVDLSKILASCFSIK
ncbi:MAG: MbnP family protein [Bacteroidota bacterium]